MKSECVSGVSDGSEAGIHCAYSPMARNLPVFSREIWKSETEKYGLAALVGLLDQSAGLVG
jgi:hypothetical protein